MSDVSTTLDEETLLSPPQQEPSHFRCCLDADFTLCGLIKKAQGKQVLRLKSGCDACTEKKNEIVLRTHTCPKSNKTCVKWW